MARGARAAGAVLVASGALAGVGAGIAASTSEAAITLPNACSVLPSAELQKITGFPPGSLAPTQTSTQQDGAPAHICSYAHDGVTLMITVYPSANDVGGYSGLPGMKMKKPPNLGSHSLFLYDNDPKYQFADVSFVTGSYFYAIHSTGLSNAKTLAVGQYVYKHR